MCMIGSDDLELRRAAEKLTWSQLSSGLFDSATIVRPMSPLDNTHSSSIFLLARPELMNFAATSDDILQPVKRMWRLTKVGGMCLDRALWTRYNRSFIFVGLLKLKSSGYF